MVVRRPGYGCARFGEVPAEENEVSERGFKLTLADVDCAAPVGLRDRVSVSALSRVCFPS